MNQQLRTITQRRNRELAGVDVNANCQNEDSEDDKENEGVDKNGLAIGAETAKFDAVGFPGDLENESWGQQNEQKYPN